MPDLLSTRDAAARCGATTRTFLRLVEDGRIAPVYRLGPGKGGAMLFKRDDVESLREQLKAQALARFDTEQAS